MMNDVASLSGTRKPACWGWLGTLIWGSSIAIIFLTLQALTMAIYLMQGRPNITEEQLVTLFKSSTYNGTAISLATLVTTLVCVPIIVGIAKLKRGARVRDYLALNPVSYRTLGRWLLATVALLALTDVLTVMLGRPVVTEFMAAAYASVNPAWLLWLAVVLAAPMFEEVFFRGFLFKGLEAKISQAGAIFLTAALWASIHLQYDVYWIGSIFLMGILLGFARAKTNSIITSFAMHAINNAGAILEVVVLAPNAIV